MCIAHSSNAKNYLLILPAMQAQVVCLLFYPVNSTIQPQNDSNQDTYHALVLFLRLRTVHRKKWVNIGKLLGRRPESVHVRYQKLLPIDG